MISDDLLERGLGAIGDGYDVPPDAVADILDQLRPADPATEYDDNTDGTSHRRWPPTRRTWLLSSAAAIVVLVVVAFAVGGGGNGGTTAKERVLRTNGAGVASGGGAPDAAGLPPVATTPLTTTARPPTAIGALAAPGQFQPSTTSKAPSAVPIDSSTKIVQTGEVDLQVDKGKVNDAVKTLSDFATQRLSGIVANSQTIAGDGAPSASVTLRVPQRSFGTLLDQAHRLGKVLSEETKSADVTAQFVDLQARLRALGLTKNTYLTILTRASTIGEILSVQERINDIQTQIEQLQGQQKVLNDQATYATLTVSIDQKAKVTPAATVHHQSGMSRAVHRSISRFVNGIEAIVGVIGPIVLVLLLIGLGWLLAKVGYRIVRRQMV